MVCRLLSSGQTASGPLTLRDSALAPASVVAYASRRPPRLCKLTVLSPSACYRCFTTVYWVRLRIGLWWVTRGVSWAGMPGLRPLSWAEG